MTEILGQFRQNFRIRPPTPPPQFFCFHSPYISAHFYVKRKKIEKDKEIMVQPPHPRGRMGPDVGSGKNFFFEKKNFFYFFSFQNFYFRAHFYEKKDKKTKKNTEEL